MKYIFTIITFLMVLSMASYAQKTIIDVPSDFTSEGNLNVAIDAAINSGTLSNTTFRLEPYGYYILTGQIVVPMGQHLEIVAPEPGTTQLTSPPQIVWTASGAPQKDIMIYSFGNVTMKNIWLRYADVAGAQVSSQIRFRDDTVATSTQPIRGVFDNVIFDYSPTPQSGAGGSVTVMSKNFRGFFNNCYWKNCVDSHLRYYGRAVSFPYQSTGYHIDSLYFDNCTFANMGYVYMQEGGEYGDNVHFNHCTFMNTIQFTLESGWWYHMSITNSIFLNTYMFGSRGADAPEHHGGTIRIDSVSTDGFPDVPWTDQDRHILFANNSYFIEDWLVQWMRYSPYGDSLYKKRENDLIPIPQPMLSPNTINFLQGVDGDGNKLFPYMNSANLFDATDPGFIVPPTNEDTLKTYLYYKWGPNIDIMWAYNAYEGFYQLWPLSENLSYTNETLKTAAMGGYPLGDLYRWWPTEYAQWESQKDAEHTRINSWLDTGIDPAVGVEAEGNYQPKEYKLGQNYPNPFNPSTKIDYSLPQTSKISIKVFNLLGQEVATVFDGIQTAGNHSVVFNAKGLVSGVYMYRLQADNVSLTKKFVLMK